MDTQKPTPSDESIRKAMAGFGKKSPSGKTVFKLQQSSINFIQDMSSKGGTMKELIDVLATIADAQGKNGEIQMVELTGEGIRKSFTISAHARDIFNRLAKVNKMSRDMIIENAIQRLMISLKQLELSPQRKIECAKIVLKAAEKMSEIYNEPEVQKAIEALRESNDPDFGTINGFDSLYDILEGVSKVDDYLSFALKDFIALKEAELAAEQTGAGKNGEDV